VTTWLNTPIQMRTIDGSTIRFAESEDCDDHALLLSPWPESLPYTLWTAAQGVFEQGQGASS